MVSLLKAQRRSLHATITPAFGLCLVLFFLVASLAYKNTTRLVASQQKVAQTNEVLSMLATAATFVERAESEQQLYLSTAATEHATAMTTDMAQATESLRAIRALTADTPTQQQNIIQLESLVATRFAEMRKAADIQGNNAADIPVPVTSENEAAPPVEMSSIRDSFEQARAEESFLLRDRTAHAAQDYQNRIWSFVWMGAAVVLGMILSYALVWEFEHHCRKIERDLSNAKQAAESASQFKSSFLASMSHEIRTPMTAIIGFADLLLRPNLSEENRHQYIDTVRRNGAHLLSIVNDILDLSKIEAGKMEVEKISCQPVRIVEDVVTLLGPKATEKAVALDVQYIGPCPETIQSDPTRLRQILTNLIANAIKFTERGTIRMFVQLAPSTDGVSRLQFRITDTGVGMTPEQIKALFTPFKQADISTSRKFGGTGLGLTIAKQFAQMLGGDITVASQSGAGSTFTVEVATGPLDAVRLIDRPQEAAKKPVPVTEVAAPDIRFTGRVLLAEDGLTNQQLISLYLKEAGAEVTIAENGKIAVEKVIAAAKAGHPFHLVLMDMEMPEMDGCEATRALRNSGYKIPVVALTANAMSADRDLCMSSGCNAFATKPIDWPRLLDLVAGYLRNKDVTGSKPNDPHLAMVLETFMKELELVENNLRKALEISDRDRIAKLAHALKGTAGNCGFATMQQIANDLAHAARGNITPENLTRQTHGLLEIITRTRTPRAA